MRNDRIGKPLTVNSSVTLGYHSDGRVLLATRLWFEWSIDGSAAHPSVKPKQIEGAASLRDAQVLCGAWLAKAV
jgi:hypothetical protein